VTALEALAYFRSLGACEPALEWLAQRISKKPEITLLELWKDAMKVVHLDPDPKYKPPEGTHTGHGWLSWVCKRHDVKCRNGTFSGMDKVYDGPHISSIKPEEVISLVVAKRNHSL
jgi:hypothetical protein